MKNILSRRSLLFFALFVFIVFEVILFRLSILPFQYYMIILIGLLIIILVLYKYENDKKDKHRFRVIVLKSFHILLSFVLLFASITMLKSSRFLDSITTSANQTIEVNVVVLKDSSFSSLKDLKDKTFGANLSIDAININKAKTMIVDEIGDIHFKEYNDYQSLMTDLKNHDIDAMIIKSIDIDSLKTLDEEFDNLFKVIEMYYVKVPKVEANGALVTKEPFHVFISGTDKEGDINTFALSDVNMVATINPQTKQILLISIPRDYYVDLITDNTSLEGVSGKDKLTHSAKGGVNCSIATVENLLGIDMNYYAKFNFTSFLNVVDTLGGVSVDIPKYKVYGNDEGVFTTIKGNYTMRPGKMAMNADQALSFVRERKSFVEGDAIRGKNQMIMLKSIIKKCMSPSVIVNMDGIFEALSDSFETNMTASEIKSLVNMQIDDMSSWDIISYSLKGDGSYRAFDLATVGNVSAVNKKGLYVTHPDSESIEKGKQYILKIMNNEIINIDD